MASASFILFLLGAIVASALASRVLPPFLPPPVIQVVIGSFIALWTGSSVDLDPDLFLLLLVPPLLFFDGWRIPKDALRQDGKIILGLALGLVFLTVACMGLFAHWLIPAMPLPVAFALAAVLSPTDPIAVSAISRKIAVPDRLLHILQGEALLNDASGLVCLHFAIAAAVAGSFSLGSAVPYFVWMALGGLATGIGSAWIAVRIQAVMGDENSGTNILITLLIPFAAYLFGEYIGASGILAAAAAGISMTFAITSRRSRASTRLRGSAVWEMAQFVLSGIVFVLLGEQLPAIISRAGRAEPTTSAPIGQLAVYILAIVGVLFALRFSWAWLSLRWTLLGGSAKWNTGKRVRVVMVATLAGSRGAITLAGILTLPVVLADGSPFPARDEAIFIAAGVIITTLLSASIGLPRLLKGIDLPQPGADEAERRRGREAAARAALAAIENKRQELAGAGGAPAMVDDVAETLNDHYRRRLSARSGSAGSRATDRRVAVIHDSLRDAALEAERDTIMGWRRDGKLGSETAARLLHEVDLVDVQWASLSDSAV